MNQTNQKLLDKLHKSSIFEKCKNKLEKIGKDLDIQKEKINLDENLLGDNNFFKFLNDLLNNLLKDFDDKKNLINELKENEKLSKEKLLTHLTNELEKNVNLNKEQKERINQNLGNEYVQNFTYNLINKKINDSEKQKENNFEINTKDVVEVGIEIAKNPTPMGVTKAVAKKTIHKMMK